MFNVGDKVVVRSMAEIRKTLGNDGMARVDLGGASYTDKLYFSKYMEWFCGKAFVISNIDAPDNITLGEYNEWSFCRAWLRPYKIDNRSVANV